MCLCMARYFRLSAHLYTTSMVCAVLCENENDLALLLGEKNKFYETHNNHLVFCGNFREMQRYAQSGEILLQNTANSFKGLYSANSIVKPFVV